MTDSDAERDAIREQLASAGLVEEYDQVDVRPRCGFVVHAPVSRRAAAPGANPTQEEGPPLAG
jgi:hypothetical protein